MTPLNCIISNSNIILNRFLEIHTTLQAQESNSSALVTKNNETYKIIRAV